MDEPRSIQDPSSSCIKKNETTKVVSQKSNFKRPPSPDDRRMGFPISYLNLISFPSSLHCLNSAEADNRRSEEEFKAVSTES